MSGELRGKVAVVTGASRGVGLAVADALEKEGATVVTVSRSGSDVGLSLTADVTRADEIARVRAQVEAEVGTPTLLVNAAGVYGPIGFVQDTDPDAWIGTLMTNTVAAYLTTRAFLCGMLDAGWGRIVNVSSAASLDPPGPLNSAYATSKAALNHFTRHVAAEVAGSGVTANVLHPGDIRTAMWADVKDQLDALGPAAERYRKWVARVDQTGGDPLEKSVDTVLRIISGDANGLFHWIDDGLKAPIPSWPAPP